jgi:hypothetical protein
VFSVKSALTNSLIISAITLALLGAAEVGLRIIYPDMNPELELRPQDVAFQFDPDHLIGLKPKMTKTFSREPENGGDTIVWRTNAESFRGAPLSTNYDLRVIVYGDSNIQARFSRLKHSFPYLLGANLERLAGRRVDVINAGVIGAGPDQSFIRMRKDIDRYLPDIVVLHIFADNDFGDLIRNRIFEISSSGAFVETEASRELTPDERRILGQTILQKHLSSFHLTLAADRIAKRLGLTAPKEKPPTDPADIAAALDTQLEEEFEVYAKRAPRAFSHFADHYDLDVATQPDTESARVKKDLMKGVLGGVRDFLKPLNIRLVVLIEASPRDLTQNQSLNYVHFSKYPNYSQDTLSSNIMEICVSLDLSCINLFNQFSKHDPETLYFKMENDHWNDAGQALAAQIAADYILWEFID